MPVFDKHDRKVNKQGLTSIMKATCEKYHLLFSCATLCASWILLVQISHAQPERENAVLNRIAEIETRLDARLGVAILDTASDMR